MITNPQQPSQDSHEDPFLSAFDFLHARLAERPALTLLSDTRQEMDQTLLALLAPLLPDPERSNRKDAKIPSDRQRYLEQAHLVLDADGIIESFSMSVPEALGYPTIMLAGRTFGSLLDVASANSWEGLLAVIQGRISIHTATALNLHSLHRQAVPAICTVFKLLNSSRLLVSCVFTLQQLPPDTPTDHQNNFRNDAALLQQLHDLIVQHLDRPLPTVPQLARQLGTNTFTLKDGFKRYFNTGIYQFYTQERLAKAKLMLTETGLSLTEIAEACGFSSTATFSKAFKKKYGMAPLPFKKTQRYR